MLASCSSRDAAEEGAGASGAPAAMPLRPGLWRATLALPGGELPFGLEIERDGTRWLAYLVNGSERTRVDEVVVEGESLRMRMPGFENTLEARIGDGELRGEVVMVKLGGKQQRIPFRARFGESWRFVAPAVNAADPAITPTTNLSGRWAVQFVAGSKVAPAVGEFQQDGSVVTGTFMTTTGDHRYLAGDIQGNVLQLSKFDGGHAFLYRALVSSVDTLDGQYWSGLAHTETFTARRDENASLGDAENVTRMRDDAAVLDIRFPDLDGRIVSLRDARFAGKVLIVALAGSWCPNCHDEAAFLAPFYAQNRARGVEVVSLMFEQFGDLPQAIAATRRFRNTYDIQYTTLIAGISDKEDAATRLPQLNGVFAFPTTIFIDRTGKVRRIHTGFSGPATGEHHRRLIEQFETLTEQLIAEIPDPRTNRPAGT